MLSTWNLIKGISYNIIMKYKVTRNASTPVQNLAMKILHLKQAENLKLQCNLPTTATKRNDRNGCCKEVSVVESENRVKFYINLGC